MPSTTTVWSAHHWAAPLEQLGVKGLAQGYVSGSDQIYPARLGIKLETFQSQACSSYESVYYFSPYLQTSLPAMPAMVGCSSGICHNLLKQYMWFSASRQPAYGYICSYLGNGRLAIFTAVVFNSGMRGQSSGTCRRESASANEKAIWGELAYWHQAWRQREAVRGESPNDRSLWTTAHCYNSSSLSFLHNVSHSVSPMSFFFAHSLLLCVFSHPVLCLKKQLTRSSRPQRMLLSSWVFFLSFFFTIHFIFVPLFSTSSPQRFPLSSYLPSPISLSLPLSVPLFLLNN